jgi:hypothetical protein
VANVGYEWAQTQGIRLAKTLFLQVEQAHPDTQYKLQAAAVTILGIFTSK